MLRVLYSPKHQFLFPWNFRADLGKRGTNQRGTTFGARSLEHIHLGHTANGAQSQKGHRVMEHNHWGTESKGAQGNGAQPLGHTTQIFEAFRGSGNFSSLLPIHTVQHRAI